MRLIPLIFLILFSSQVSGQSYIEYNRIINRVDEDILIDKDEVALARLDSIYKNYSFIYAKHCFKALQISCKSGNTIKANQWLEKSFIQGVPIWMIRINELTKNVFDYASLQNTIDHYDSLRNIYIKSINSDLRNKVDSLFKIDQHFTQKVNNGFFLFRPTYHNLKWMNNNKTQYEAIVEIIDHYGFPGERLIGLPKYIEDSTQAVKNFKFYGPVLNETNVYIMLIHYYSNPRADIIERLIKNVNLGNLPSYQFGALNDFMARWGKKRYGDYKYYNVWHIDKNEANKEEIETRRKAIGLNSFETQNKNMLIWRERRKSNTANAEIIIE